MRSTVSTIISTQTGHPAVTLHPYHLHSGAQYVLQWGRYCYGPNPTADSALGRLKETSFLNKAFSIGAVFESVDRGLTQACTRVREWKRNSPQKRGSSVALAGAVFAESLAGPTYDVSSLTCSIFKATSSPGLQACEPYAYAVASAAASIGAVAVITTTTQQYGSATSKEEKRPLLIKLAKAIATFVLGILGIIALRYGPIYSTISLAGATLLYFLGMCEKVTKEPLPSLPSF